MYFLANAAVLYLKFVRRAPVACCAYAACLCTPTIVLMDTCLLFRQERIVPLAGAAFVPDTLSRLGPAVIHATLPNGTAGPLIGTASVPLLWRQSVICKLQIPIVATDGAALVAIDDFQQIPVQAGLVRAEPFDQLCGIKNARRWQPKQWTDKQVPAASLPPSVASENGYPYPWRSSC